MQERSDSIGNGYHGNLISTRVNVDDVEEPKIQEDENRINMDYGDRPLQVTVRKKESPLAMGRELNRLLKKAAIQSYDFVSQESMDAIRTSVRLTVAEEKELSTAYENMQKAMTKINAMHGSDFGKVFKAKSKENKIVRTAIDTQLELAVLLHALAERQDDDETRMKLDGLAMKCELRSSEIGSLAGELADLAAAQGKKKGQVVRDERLDKLFSAMIAEKAVGMHGTEEALQRLGSFVEPVMTCIDRYREHPEAFSPLEVETLRRDIGDLKKALEYARDYGLDMSQEYDTAESLKDGGKVGDNGRVMIEPFIFKKMIGVLDSAYGRLQDCAKTVREQHLLNYVKREFREPPFTAYFQLLDEFEAKGRPVDPENKLAAVRTFVDIYIDLRVNANRYAKQPSPELKSALKAGLEKMRKAHSSVENARALMKQLLSTVAAKQKNPYDFNEDDSDVDENEEIQELREKAGKMIEKDRLKALAHFVDGMDGLEMQLEHMFLMADQMSLKDKPLEQVMTSQDVVALYDGEVRFSTVLEAHIHNVSTADFDQAFDTSKLVRSRPLGKGSFNTVMGCDFRQQDGTVVQSVFKPELAGRIAMDDMSLSWLGNYGKEQHIYDLNIASYETARVFGLEGNIVKSSLGTYHGDYGLFMEKAPGMSPRSMIVNKDAKQDNGLSTEELQYLPVVDEQRCLGNMMHQLSNLQWLDLLTGQGDRHNNNYMVSVDSEMNVSVKGIDNDTCFPENRTGVMKFMIPARKQLELFLDLIDDGLELSSSVSLPRIPRRRDANTSVEQITKIQQAYVQKYGPTFFKEFFGGADGFTIDPQSGLIQSVDLSKIRKNRGVAMAVVRDLFGFHTCCYPSVIDQELRDAFLSMKNSPQRLETWKKQLSKRMSEAAVEATMGRFNDICSYLETMKRRNVLSGEGWYQRDWKKAPAIEDMLPENTRDQGGGRAELVTDLNKSIKRLSSDFMYRDFSYILKLK